MYVDVIGIYIKRWT